MATVGARLRSRLAAGGRSHDSFSSSPSPPVSAPPPRSAPTPTVSSAGGKISSATTKAEPLSEKDLRDVRTAFVILDRDGDGQLGVEDMTTSLQQLGYQDVNAQSVQEFINKVTHGGCSIKENEMLTWLEAKSASCSSTTILQNAFSTLDRDNDGYVTKSDLEFALTIAHENLSPNMLKLMFDEADSDHDGKIDIKDFLRALGEL